MLWMTWRQFRLQAVVGATALAGAVTFLLVLGVNLHADYQRTVAGCVTSGCAPGLVAGFEHTYDVILTITDIAVIALPGLLGVFWGAPLISSELPAGTHRLAWHQGVPRHRWLTTKLLFVGTTAVTFSGLLGLLLTWAAQPYDALKADRFSALVFGARDVVPLAYTAFALAFGTAAGLVLRRPVAAMALTLAVYTAAQFLVPTLLRPTYLPPQTADIRLDATTLAHADGIILGDSSLSIASVHVPDGWVVSSGQALDSSGHAPSPATLSSCIAPGRFTQTIDCLARQDLHVTASYQPGDRYWPFQWIETALYITVGGLGVALCFFWTRRTT